MKITEEYILRWMRQKVRQDGFSNATTLAESFLSAHKINDALDPVFSLSLDAGFKLAQELRDQKMAMALT